RSKTACCVSRPAPDPACGGSRQRHRSDWRKPHRKTSSEAKGGRQSRGKTKQTITRRTRTVPKHPTSGQFAIVGLGVVAGQQPDRSERMIASEAARLAIVDAGLTPKDIDGAIDLRRTGGGGDRASYVDAYSRMLGLNNCFYFVVGRGGALAGLGIAT